MDKKEKLRNDLLDRYFFWRGKGKNHLEAIQIARQEQIDLGLKLLWGV